MRITDLVSALLSTVRDLTYDGDSLDDRDDCMHNEALLNSDEHSRVQLASLGSVESKVHKVVLLKYIHFWPPIFQRFMVGLSDNGFLGEKEVQFQFHQDAQSYLVRVSAHGTPECTLRHSFHTHSTPSRIRG